MSRIALSGHPEKMGERGGGGIRFAGSRWALAALPGALHLTPPCALGLKKKNHLKPNLQLLSCFSRARHSLDSMVRVKSEINKTPPPRSCFPLRGERGGHWGPDYLFVKLGSEAYSSFPPHPRSFYLAFLIFQLFSLSCLLGSLSFFLPLGSRNNGYVKGQWASPYKAQNLINFIKGGSVYAIWQPGGINHLKTQTQAGQTPESLLIA